MKKLDSGNNYARYEIGELGVVALRDGYVDMPPSRLRQAGDRPFGTDLPEQVKLVDGKLRLSVNAFLIMDGDQRILIDAGAANAWEPTMGTLLRALAEAGLERGDVTTVAFTHTHLDHINGVVAADGSDAFPNLDRLLVPREEVPLFDSEPRLARFRRFRSPLEAGFKLSPNVTAIQAHGHEVGHTAFEVSSAGETLIIWGDTVHVPSIQFTRPELTWEYDADQTAARSTREQLMRRASRPNCFVAGAHHDFPGIGTVVEAESGFCYRPL
ncbi:MAG TPA: MBL fold metallo-hydrolase [Dongiaceae bacterium]|nr:MBL fold metallo-hydrolase [Dongiaceae bacterium]